MHDDDDDDECDDGDDDDDDGDGDDDGIALSMPSYSSSVTLTTASKVSQHAGGRPARRPPTAKPKAEEDRESGGGRTTQSYSDGSTPSVA